MQLRVTGGARNGVTTMAVVMPNPWGCYSRSDNPHLSTTAPGLMDAKGWTICTISGFSEEYVESWLYYWDCFFFICRWTQTDHQVGQQYRYMQYQAVVAHNCNGSADRNYRIETYSRVRGWVSSTYTSFDGWTAAEATIACNA